MENENLKSFLDSDNSLLMRFRDKAPGTFKHCQNVMNLCETIAIELKLDVEFMKVCGMFHDIGKINQPEAFSENQNGKNMHDILDPAVSYQLITRHVGDTIVILLNEGFPRRVLEVISQHHGDSVLKYFYDKAGSKTVDDIYRYKCKKPSSTEAIVLMICDCIEATARSVFSNGKLNDQDSIDKLVYNSIKRMEADEQLDALTYGQGRIIKKVLMKELSSIYHKREIYGDETKEEK